MRSLILASSVFYLFSSSNVAPIVVNNKRDIERLDKPSLTLRIYNSEDYIADGKDASLDIISAFQKKVLEEDGVNLTVAYDTFDTNEIMLSNLETGSQIYDLICTSDYMIQRMMTMGIVKPFVKGEEARKNLYVNGYKGWEKDNYDLYASPWLREKYGSITAKVGEETAYLSDYMRGYMWGTLGIMYNPTYKVYEERGLSKEDVILDMADYSSLWAPNYAGTFQIKDSMRDSYAIALLETFKDYFLRLQDRYQNGDLSAEEYNKKINVIFNNISHLEEFNSVARELGSSTDISDTEIIDMIQSNLSFLKDNSYGLEVDSGKTDIQSGTRTGINMAWSGDAVYAIGSAKAYGTNLYYSVPKIGGNVWLDGWVMSKDSANQEYAQKFIDFISDPEIAAANMDYIGYTSAIAGDSILEQARNWYDARLHVLYRYDEENDSYVYDENENLVRKEEYLSLNDEEFNLLLQSGNGTIEGKHYDSWEKYSEGNNLGWTKVDLSYFFNNSLSSYQNNMDTAFYSDEYEKVKKGDKEAIGGRAFYAQYPPSEIVPSLMVMEDYGEDNEFVLKMWENVRSGSVPRAVTVILTIEAALLLTFLGYFIIRNSTNKALRKRRRAEKNSQ